MINRMFFSITLFLMVPPLQAQNISTSKIVAATVYRQKAELNSQSIVTLKKGDNTIVIRNLPAKLEESTLVISAGNKAMITGYSFKKYDATLPATAKHAAYTDSIAGMKKQIGNLNARLTVVNEKVAIIQKNQQVFGENTGLNVTELTKMLDLIDAKMESLLLKRITIEEQTRQLNDQIRLMEMQQKAEAPVSEFAGELSVNVVANAAATYTLSASYLIPDAGWRPVHDIVASQTSQPIKIISKAEVYQSSAIDWDNVHLTLSSGVPKKEINAPALMPWWLSYIPKPVQNVYATEVSPQLYAQKRGQGISIGGARKSGTLYVIDGLQEQNTAVPNGVNIPQYVASDVSGINTRYDIIQPYSIKSGNGSKMVVLMEQETPAFYRHYTAPRKGQEVYLQAIITNWHRLNLISGDMNLFYDGSYIGSSNLDLASIQDSLAIFLGRDNKIVVSRTSIAQKRNVSTIGTTIREDFGWTISAKNLRTEPIALTIQDQLPLSSESGISLENEEIDGASKNAATGIVTWELAIPSGQTKNVNIGYTVRYPKDKSIRGLRD